MDVVFGMAGKPGMQEFRRLLAEGGLPELGPGPRAGILPQAELNQALDGLLARSALPSVSRDLIRALILLWHDRLEAAHLIAQGIENADGSFLHGIVHRREPDYGNAAYWFHRVPDHPCYPSLAGRVEEKLAGPENLSLKQNLLPRGEWDPLAFIRQCEKSANLPAANAQVNLLRTIQGIESEILLEHFLRPE